MSIKYSFVLPTYNRITLLKETLQSMIDQDFPKDQYEIIVIDDHSPDETEAYMEEMKKKYSNIVYSRNYRNYRNYGEAYCRNKGIELAHGEIIVQTEDDAKYAHNYLSAIDQEIQKVGNKKRWTLVVMPRKTRNFSDGIIPKLVEFRRASIDRLTKLWKREIIWGWIYKKSLYEKIWGYKHMQIWADAELVKRFKDNGYAKLAIFSTFWRHSEPKTFAHFFKRQYRNGYFYKEYKEEFTPNTPLLAKLFWMGILIFPLLLILLSCFTQTYFLPLYLYFFLVILSLLHPEIRGMYPEIIKSKYPRLLLFVSLYYGAESYGILIGRVARSLKEKQNFIY